MPLPNAIFPGEPRGIGASQLSSRNATRINLSIEVTNPSTGKPEQKRVGRILTLSESVNNNMQALRELGAQVLVELKKGITEYSFTIDKMWVRGDYFDELIQGAIFSLETVDEGGVNPGNPTAGGSEALEVFKYCAIDSAQKTITAGQATVAFSVRVVTIGQPQTGSLAEGF